MKEWYNFDLVLRCCYWNEKLDKYIGLHLTLVWNGFLQNISLEILAMEREPCSDIGKIKEK